MMDCLISRLLMHLRRRMSLSVVGRGGRASMERNRIPTISVCGYILFLSFLQNVSTERQSLVAVVNESR